MSQDIVLLAVYAHLPPKRADLGRSGSSNKETSSVEAV
jgi:hypothetical protein